MCTDGIFVAGCGTVFELSPDGSGGWSEEIIHNFRGTDGWFPNSRLIMDAAGNLYGSTSYGGKKRFGRDGVRTTAFGRRLD
jgi:hypothetical protein